MPFKSSSTAALPCLFMSSSHASAAAALLAQLKFDSVILEVITVASAVAFVGRVTLSYKRLNDRWVVVPARFSSVLVGGCVSDGMPIPPPEATEHKPHCPELRFTQRNSSKGAAV